MKEFIARHYYYYYYYIPGLNKFLVNTKSVSKKRSTRDHLSWTIWNVHGFYARGVYPTQDNSCIGTAKVKQEEEANFRKRSVKYGRKKREQDSGKSPQTRLN